MTMGKKILWWAVAVILWIIVPLSISWSMSTPCMDQAIEIAEQLQAKGQLCFIYEGYMIAGYPQDEKHFECYTNGMKAISLFWYPADGYSQLDPDRITAVYTLESLKAKYK